MIRPAEIDLPVQRNASFPSVDPFTLSDRLTGVPLNITGATFTFQARLYEGAPGDPLLEKDLPIVDAERGLFSPPAITKAEHEALVEAAAASVKDQQSTVRLRYEILAEDVPGWPAEVVVARGFYPVRTGVVR